MHERKGVELMSLAHEHPEICELMARCDVHPFVYFDGDEYVGGHWKETELSIERSVGGIPIFF